MARLRRRCSAHSGLSVMACLCKQINFSLSITKDAQHMPLRTFTPCRSCMVSAFEQLHIVYRHRMFTAHHTDRAHLS